MCKFTLGISSWRSSIVTKKKVFLFSLEIRVLSSFFVYFGDIPLTDDTSVINGTVITIFVPKQSSSDIADPGTSIGSYIAHTG